MPPKKHNNNKKGRKKSKASINPSAQMQFYRGPGRIPGTGDSTSLTTIELMTEGNVTSTGGGVITFGFNASLNQFAEYTNFTAVFDEWRLLYCRLDYYPNALNAVQTIVSAPYLWVIDRDSTSALVSYAVTSESSTIRTTNSLMHKVYRMSGSEDAGFITNPATAFCSFKSYATGVSNSMVYGIYVVKALFQFRGRV